MKVKRRLISSLVAIVLTLTVAIRAQAVQPLNQEKGQDAPTNGGKDKGKDDPTNGSKDVDQTIPYPMDKALEAAKQALATYGCNIKKEKADSLECTRDRHVGLVIGSGGEKVTVKLSPKGDETRVEIKTGKGFVGRLAKKNWSTPIFDEMMKTLKGS